MFRPSFAATSIPLRAERAELLFRGPLLGSCETSHIIASSGFIRNFGLKRKCVRGAVRDPGDVAKVGHLLKLPGAKERLVLAQANLLQEGSFDRVFEGVEGVFHTASPVPSTTPPDVQKDLLEPAVKGTVNVLTSASKAKTVKRVVLTSSTSAVTASKGGWSPENPNIIIDESWWSDPEWCRNNKSFYALSKTQAERTAWDFAKENDLDLVVMNPATVLGTPLQSSINASTQIILGYLNGSKTEISNRMYGFVHVKNVAMAHVLAFEKPEAEGRYLLVESTIHAKQLAELLRVLYPQCAIPNKYVDDQPPLAGTYSSDRIRKLGLEFTPAIEAIKECVESCREKGWINC
ncbi:hypothetical protein R1flu_026423 [Riccia fluitans]|uniref:NAD-dependent epimerase/dehydratase domain-containing protein n=1 Tax=Riccia fluitans TaxID=41844 RepID=A0ABD1XFW6_9MARC